jgi:hypothetical protein
MGEPANSISNTEDSIPDRGASHWTGAADRSCRPATAAGQGKATASDSHVRTERVLNCCPELVESRIEKWAIAVTDPVAARRCQASYRGELPARTPPDLIIDAIMGRVISLVALTPGAQRAAISARRHHYAASITDFVLQAVTWSAPRSHALSSRTLRLRKSACPG